MIAHAIIFVAMGALLGGCANNQSLLSDFVRPAEAADADPSKQTVASKVLGAIALERITDRKPDPSRLNELH